MRHRKAGRQLRRTSEQKLALMRNLASSLIEHGAIETTEAKAKEVRGLAERVITMGKRGDLHSRRRALGVVYDKKVVEKVFDDLGPRYASRPGGYSRLVKLGPRQGDGARMAQLELIGEEA